MTTKPETNGERTVTVEEAATDLAGIIEQVRAGVTVRITRDGVEVYVMEPPTAKSYKASDILKRLEGKPEIRADDKFADDLEAVINLKRPPSEPLEWD